MVQKMHVSECSPAVQAEIRAVVEEVYWDTVLREVRRGLLGNRDGHGGRLGASDGVEVSGVGGRGETTTPDSAVCASSL